MVSPLQGRLLALATLKRDRMPPTFRPSRQQRPRHLSIPSAFTLSPHSPPCPPPPTRSLSPMSVSPRPRLPPLSHELKLKLNWPLSPLPRLNSVRPRSSSPRAGAQPSRDAPSLAHHLHCCSPARVQTPPSSQPVWLVRGRALAFPPRLLWRRRKQGGRGIDQSPRLGGFRVCPLCSFTNATLGQSLTGTSALALGCAVTRRWRTGPTRTLSCSRSVAASLCVVPAVPSTDLTLRISSPGRAPPRLADQHPDPDLRRAHHPHRQRHPRRRRCFSHQDRR